MGLFNFFGKKPKSTKDAFKKAGDIKELHRALGMKVNSPEIMDGKPIVKVSKTIKVLNHLKEHGTITSWEAITKYKATRLSNIIFTLRRKRGLDIETVDIEHIDVNGNPVTYAKYVYHPID